MTTNRNHRKENLAAWLLRLDSVAHILAAVVVFLPQETIAQLHERLGLGVFPDSPIAWYLARGLSAYYAMHGTFVLILSFHIRRYLRLVRLLVRLFAAYGLLMVFVDLQAAMPTWWVIAEPAFILVFSATVLMLLADSTSESDG